MHLFYDERDARYHEAHGSQILYWLDELGAKPLKDALRGDVGFLFTGARTIDDYRQLVAGTPDLRDTAEEREVLLTLDTVLDALSRASVQIPTPKTWRLPLDEPLPKDLAFPLFVRTAHSSWKLGSKISRVRSAKELESEAAELRRAMGWNALILARAWHEFAPAGESMYGPVAQEVRVWIVDQVPFAWSFHYLNVVREPHGFPPHGDDLRAIAGMARDVGRAFHSRLVAADFARQTNGDWIFVEAGPGSCAGTAHEAVFKAVASRLRGEESTFRSDAVGGIFEASSADGLVRPESNKV
ncbi:MAG: ATP-grasp domain-containing protein [Gemmataceae bacterium]|nr:ATP-grasp domain-containing protein [Gemmataceae bacterium]